MPVGVGVLLAVSILVFLGVAHRVLDRMHLTDKQALILLGLMILGSFVDIPIYRNARTISLNVGGGIIPVVMAIWILARADSPRETSRAVLGSIITGGFLYAVSKVFTFEEGHTIIDPVYLFGIMAGIVAYIAGRSRRAAFIGGIIGVLLLDLAHLVEVSIKGLPSTVHIGGGGILDAIVLAGVIAVVLAELFGEVVERVKGGPEGEKDNETRG
ncbi:MAG TPA: DUF1614 domain-containing protein [Firmicutes bacterium]|nr:DUF1614 domain-containing protein [Bacillota bacterium]